jgi:hypothetical protein
MQFYLSQSYSRRGFSPAAKRLSLALNRFNGFDCPQTVETVPEGQK